MKVITIKFENTGEWHFLLELLKRLNIRFEWKEDTNIPNQKKNSPPSDAVSKLFGSFSSDKTSDELVKSIYDARVTQTREISL
ncbi:MAG: hypothetical protein K9J37_20180 [Saprospiraceae bacterium]|nr:hypothetical protein [Saprospiraceae bacterium]MCF8252246.1 hypothetical protein [Saprospiraceae bacterium]MCF8282347.1 hypothetical protein [Bacteroidales bacterium]MCF8313874.1 hypothetical protein [Saprospiraceae bacterium]MCF8442893.1 hypothetical protein [Saprospiraceae bacterium]